MKFVGLDGLSHFWTKAKSWIIDRITTEVTAKIAEIVANAPEDLDTLKEISDWISSHANDAAAMNTAILANTEAISGKADKNHTHIKSDITDFPTSLKNPNALTINGKTYDGSTAVDAGVQTVENGGTGATTTFGAFESLANGLPEGAGPLDTEHIIFQNENRKNWGLYTLSQFWEYIKGKISSVLGLTKDAYGGKASTAGTANKIEPNYTSVALTEVTSYTGKYIKVADCAWSQTGTLQVHLRGNCLEDTLVINFGGGNALYPMLCGHYNGNSSNVISVIAQTGPKWNSNYSIYVKVNQLTDCTVRVALLKGDCTIDISESTTEPTNIYEWNVGYGLFGNIVSPEITSLEQRVAALESKV